MTTSDSAAKNSREGTPTSSGVIPWAVAGVIAVRLVIAQHAPSPVDAALLLTFAALALLLFYRERAVFQNAPLPSLFFVAVVLVTSTIASRHPLISLLGMSAPLGALMGFLSVAGAGAAGQRGGLVGLLTGTSVCSLVAIVQRFYVWPDALQRRDELSLDASVIEVLSRGRPLGLSLSPDLMGGLALIGIAAGLALLAERSRQVRAILLCLVVINGTAL
ncbi:MAG: hypothetical protein ACO3JL_07250, partial [Myxococcota bacterium]